MKSSLHVLIIGGGLGGLTLAQGLKKAKISVALYERDRSPDDRLQGYRIHIEAQGNQALYGSLPDHLFRRYVDTAGSGGNGHRIVTDQLQQVAFFGALGKHQTTSPADLDLSVSRITLRQILLSELEGVVHFDKTFTRYEETAEGQVIAHFADGSSAVGDLLVAADGSNSAVRRQFLPKAERQDTRVQAIMGKVPLTEEIRRLLIPGQLDGATTVLGPNGYGMFMALHEFRDTNSEPVGNLDTDDKVLMQGQPGFLFDNRSDYLFWAFLAQRDKFPSLPNLQDMEGPALQQVVLKRTEGWHANLRSLVRQADVATLICKPLYTATPVSSWQTGRVTLLGDAIHSMPPTRGIGGNTALRDADLLRQKLIAVQAGTEPLVEALHAYEVEMRKYGFAAVRDSLQSMKMITAQKRFFYNLMLKMVSRLAA